MKLVKYFLQKKSLTILLLLLVLFGGLFAYVKMGKLEDAPFTIKQALVLTPYPGASPSEVQTQVTDVLEESIQSLGELYYLKTENRAGLSKITVYVKKEIRADEMQQLWDKLRRKVSDVQGKLPAGAGPSVVNDDFGDVLGVFYGLTGMGHTYRELEDQAKLIKNEILKVKDVAKVEIYGVQTPTIDVKISPSVMALSGITTADIARAFEGQNKVVDAGGIDVGENRAEVEKIQLPEGYTFFWDAQFKDQKEAIQAIVMYFPLAFLLLVVILVALFGNFRQPIIILCVLPLSLIGVAVGMLLTGFDFGFFPIAGWLGLLGMIIKNVIVLIDEINVQHGNGVDLYTCIVEATVVRTRPVLMAATTTIFGMVPLLFDIAFGGMAATIIFGLTFATLLTLFVTPALYAIFYNVKEN